MKNNICDYLAWNLDIPGLQDVIKSHSQFFTLDNILINIDVDHNDQAVVSFDDLDFGNVTIEVEKMPDCNGLTQWRLSTFLFEGDVLAAASELVRNVAVIASAKEVRSAINKPIDCLFLVVELSPESPDFNKDFQAFVRDVLVSRSALKIME